MNWNDLWFIQTRSGAAQGWHSGHTDPLWPATGDTRSKPSWPDRPSPPRSSSCMGVRVRCRNLRLQRHLGKVEAVGAGRWVKDESWSRQHWVWMAWYNPDTDWPSTSGAVKSPSQSPNMPSFKKKHFYTFIHFSDATTTGHSLSIVSPLWPHVGRWLPPGLIGENTLVVPFDLYFKYIYLQSGLIKYMLIKVLKRLNVSRPKLKFCWEIFFATIFNKGSRFRVGMVARVSLNTENWF